MGKPPMLLPSSSPTLSPPPRNHPYSRSPTRHRITDDLLSDLSPTTTFDAFTSPSGKLKASIEAATEGERAFGVRASLASKKIQEWLDELSYWPWPTEGGSAGFETPPAKRRKLSEQRLEAENTRTDHERNDKRDVEEVKSMGSLSAEDVHRYEIRIDEITEDMEDLKVEDIKRQVLDTHFSPRSRPSSSSSTPPMPTLLAYTRMDDLTAVVTATVLQALPNLSKLMHLMGVWSVRLATLRKIPRLLANLSSTELALKSVWQAIGISSQSSSPSKDFADENMPTREYFDKMRGALQNRVTLLGQELDCMLDTLEGRQDTLPDSWLDRMEDIERGYGEWVVAGDRKVGDGDWARMARARAEERRKLEAEERQMKEAKEARAAKALRLEEEQRRTNDEARAAEEARLEAERWRLEVQREMEATETARKEMEEQRRTEEQEASGKAERLQEEQRLQQEMKALAADNAEKENTARSLEVAEDGQHSVGHEEAVNLGPTVPESQVLLEDVDQDPDLISTRPELDFARTVDAQRPSLDRIVDDGLYLGQHPSFGAVSDEESVGQSMASAHEKIRLTNFRSEEPDLPEPTQSSDRLGTSQLHELFQTAPLPALEIDSANRAVDQHSSSPASSPCTPLPPTSFHDSAFEGKAPPYITPSKLPFRNEWHVLDESNDEAIESSDLPAVSRPDELEFYQSADSRSRSTSFMSEFSLSESVSDLQAAEVFHAFHQVLSPIRSESPALDEAPSLPIRSSDKHADLDTSTTPLGTPPGPAKVLTMLETKERLRINVHDGSQESAPSGRRDSAFSLQKFDTRRPASKDPNATAIFHQGPDSPQLITPSSPLIEDDSLPPFKKEEPSPSAGRIGSRHITSDDDSPPISPPYQSFSHRRFSQISQAASDFSETTSEVPLFESVELSHSNIISPRKPSTDDQFRQQIHTILDSIPSDIRFGSEPPSGPSATPKNILHPRKVRRSTPSQRNLSSSVSTRSEAPTLTLAPAISQPTTRHRPTSSKSDIKLYHLSRSSNDEKPIKLLVRLVGEHGERVMVRVGGGWADLAEYLKEYASHHGSSRRAASGTGGASGGDAAGKVEIIDLNSSITSSLSSSTRKVSSLGNSATTATSGIEGRQASPRERPASALLERGPDGPLSSLATRQHRVSSVGESTSTPSTSSNFSTATAFPQPSTPKIRTTTRKSDHNASDSGPRPGFAPGPGPASGHSFRSRERSGSRLSWTEDSAVSLDGATSGGMLGLAGPTPKDRRTKELEREDLEWVESMKERVRVASVEKIGSRVGGRKGECSKDRERERDAGRDLGMQGKGMGKRVVSSGGSVAGHQNGYGKESEASNTNAMKDEFGELETIGGTKRLFRRSGGGVGTGVFGNGK